MGAVLSVQVGAAVATTLFDELGPSGTVLLRTGFAAVILVAIWRPKVPRGAGGPLRDAVLLGIALAGMNLSFYAALDRIPLGIAVTFEFTGPFAVAVAGSRRASDLLWVALAAGGIALLSPGVHGSLDGLGVAFALLAGGFWAAYIVLAARVGRGFSGGQGLALAMAVAAVVLLPVGVAGGGGALGAPGAARRRPRGRRAQLRDPLLARAGGAAATPEGDLRGPDEPRARCRGARRPGGARAGPQRHRGGRDRPGGGRKRGCARRGAGAGSGRGLERSALAVSSRLVAAALGDRQARVARIGGVGARALAEREARAARRADDSLVDAGVAEAGGRARHV